MKLKKDKNEYKKNESLLLSIQNQVQKQMELKQNAFLKLISEDISQKDYDDFVGMVQDKLQQLELERAEIKKAIAESNATSKISAIIEQLKEYLTFNILISEMLLRFVDKIEINENKDIKIYYNLAQVKGF